LAYAIKRSSNYFVRHRQGPEPSADYQMIAP
jgi:hypothetical protein